MQCVKINRLVLAEQTAWKRIICKTCSCAFRLSWAPLYISFNQPMWRSWRPPTLLCTSHGLVIADKSQPVIIMALGVRDRQTVRGGKMTHSNWCWWFAWVCCFRHFLTNILQIKLDRMSSKDALSSAWICYIHDNFLPGGVVGNIGNGLLFIRHWLCGIHNVLEHGSLSAWGQTDEIAESQSDRLK